MTALACLGFAALFFASEAHAQVPASSPWFTKGLSSPASKADAPPREVPLVEKKWDDLSNKETGRLGKSALEIAPEKWKHAETENFIIHYRRVTEAQKVVREIEFDIWFIAKTLGASRDRYLKKSHVFVFEDEAEWRLFSSGNPVPQWASSFAHGDELFLNIRRVDATGRFDSYTLAHEVTHAVVARLYPQKHWPLWLNEGFAEYMAGASVAARKNQSVKRHQQTLKMAEMPIEEMTALKEYPRDEEAVARLYQTAEKLVRFLKSELPRDQFPAFVEAMLDDRSLTEVLLEFHGDTFKDFNSFKKRYEKFDK